MKIINKPTPKDIHSTKEKSGISFSSMIKIKLDSKVVRQLRAD